MKLTCKALFLLVAVVSGVSAAGAEPARSVTLNAVVSAARSNNRELLSMRKRLFVLEAEVAENSAYPNPSVELERQTPFNSGYQEFKVYQPFAVGGRIGLSKRASKAGVEAFRADIAALENEVIASAKKAYYSFRLAGEHIRFEEANLKFAMDMLNRMEIKFQTGQAGNSDVARAKVEVAQSRYRLESAQSALKEAQAGLNYLMGLKPDSAVSVAEDGTLLSAPLADTPKPFAEIISLALSNRHDLKALTQRGKTAETVIALEKRKRIPDLTLGFITGKDPEERYSKVSFGIELPLWYRNSGAIAKAEAGQAVLGEESELLSLSVQREVYTAWLGHGLSVKRVRAAKEIVTALNELRKNASLDYLSGKSGMTAFYETNRIFVEENLNYLDGLQEYYEKSIELEKAAGIAAGE